MNKSTYFLRDASYVSIVFVWIITEVSPRWKYWLSFVIVRVTLQDWHKAAAIVNPMTIVPPTATRAIIWTLVIVFLSFCQISVQRYYLFLTYANFFAFFFIFFHFSVIFRSKLIYATRRRGGPCRIGLHPEWLGGHCEVQGWHCEVLGWSCEVLGWIRRGLGQVLRGSGQD